MGREKWDVGVVLCCVILYGTLCIELNCMYYTQGKT
jgi:hypothetical protein